MSYEDCLRDAMRLQKISIPDDKCAHLARSIFKMKNKYTQQCAKKSEQSTVLLNYTPKHVVEARHKQNICKSVTLRGKSCQFKASCDGYCRKHSLNKSDYLTLGRKI
jgi:hypothetical protein